MVCRQLGFKQGAFYAQCCSAYGEVPDLYSYDDVTCRGQEATLNDCPHANVDDCTGFEGAGVVCIPNSASELYVKIYSPAVIEFSMVQPK